MAQSTRAPNLWIRLAKPTQTPSRMQLDSARMLCSTGTTYKDMTVSDVGVADLDVDGQVADMGPAECGNGIVESGEACDDGNVELEQCEAYNQTCMVCGPQCELVEVSGPACGDGIHQMNERCDPSAGNVHAQMCSQDCWYSYRQGGQWPSTRGSVLPIVLRVEVFIDDEEAVAAGETVDLDIWAFHPNARYEEPMAAPFAFSEASNGMPAWMGEAYSMSPTQPAHSDHGRHYGRGGV